MTAKAVPAYVPASECDATSEFWERICSALTQNRKLFVFASLEVAAAGSGHSVTHALRRIGARPRVRLFVRNGHEWAEQLGVRTVPEPVREEDPAAGEAMHAGGGVDTVAGILQSHEAAPGQAVCIGDSEDDERVFRAFPAAITVRVTDAEQPASAAQYYVRTKNLQELLHGFADVAEGVG